MSFYEDEQHYVNDTDYSNNEPENDPINNFPKMEDYIRELWDIVMIPYLENYKERQILSRLTVNDYNKFYEFMMKNNDVCKQIIEEDRIHN